jgi:hypothetical protein
VSCKDRPQKSRVAHLGGIGGGIAAVIEQHGRMPGTYSRAPNESTKGESAASHRECFRS